MRSPVDTDKEAPVELAQRVARLLRHEVGDLLQSVYSTTAVLLERLTPAFDQERQLLADLKGRAELCKQELEAVVELVTPQSQRLATIATVVPSEGSALSSSWWAWASRTRRR